MPAIIDIEKKYYDDVIERLCPAGVCFDNIELPYFHNCSGAVFRKILGKGEICAQHCDEFSEALLYLFYGKPSYRSTDRHSSRDMGRFPVSFVIRNKRLVDITRIFPFDSGAFLNDFLKCQIGDINSSVAAIDEIKAYQLRSDFDFLAKFIHALYENDKAYFSGETKLSSSEVPALSLELRRIIELHRAEGTQDWDERAITVELQKTSSIELNSTEIEAVILPSQIISNDTDLQDFFYDEGIEVISYNAPMSSPSDMSMLLRASAKSYLESAGLL